MATRARWSRSDKTKGISITLPESTIEALADFLMESGMHSRSAIVDKAILEFISSRTTKHKEVSNG